MPALIWIFVLLVQASVAEVWLRSHPPDAEEKHRIAVRCVQSYMHGEVDVANIINTTDKYVVYDGDVVYDYFYGDGCVLNIVVDKYGRCDSGGRNCDSSGKKYEWPDAEKKISCVGGGIASLPAL